MTMETCKLCDKVLKSENGVTAIAHANGVDVHYDCAVRVVSGAIAAREAEKPKAPTLEERVAVEIQFARTACVIVDEMARRLIALVRGHDATALRETTPNDVLQLHNEVITRERDEARAQLQIAREMIDAARSALST
jgi:hypothetical protein